MTDKFDFTDLVDVKLKDDVATWPEGLRLSVKSHFNRIAVDQDLEIETVYGMCRLRTDDEFPGQRSNQHYVAFVSNVAFEAEGRKATPYKLERWTKDQQEYQRVMRTGDPAKIEAYHAKHNKGAAQPVPCCVCKEASTTVIDGAAYCTKHATEHREQKVMA